MLVIAQCKPLDLRYEFDLNLGVYQVKHLLHPFCFSTGLFLFTLFKIRKIKRPIKLFASELLTDEVLISSACSVKPA